MKLLLLIGLFLCVSSQAHSFYLSDTVANYGIQYVGTIKDTTFLFINPPSSKKTYVVEQIGLSVGTDFSVVNISQKLPYQANPGDTVYYTIRYTVKDTTTHFDTIYVKTDCDFRQKIVKGEGGCGILVSSDHDFGKAAVSDSYYVGIDTVKITNVGKLPIILTKDLIFSNDSVFTSGNIIVGNREISLPWYIFPNQKIRIRLAYYPLHEGTDTSTLYLGTDIPSEFSSYGKPYIKLKGTGVVEGVEWDTDSLIYTSPRDTIIKRVYLRATHSLATEVDSIFIVGPDADEFFIHQTERPIEHGVVIDVADSIWLDVGFKPDLSKPSSLVRSAYIRMIDKSDYNRELDTVVLHGIVSPLKVSNVNTSVNSIYPNPARDYILVSGNYKEIKLFDALGREVKLQVNYHAKPIRINLSGLPSGAYNLQVKDASGQVVLEKLIVE
ncbi:MAG TPA: T9SS type A sorting domain-containing protein [Candidatus Kapabacteria bacterium]